MREEQIFSYPVIQKQKEKMWRDYKDFATEEIMLESSLEEWFLEEGNYLQWQLTWVHDWNYECDWLNDCSLFNDDLDNLREEEEGFYFDDYNDILEDDEDEDYEEDAWDYCHLESKCKVEKRRASTKRVQSRMKRRAITSFYRPKVIHRQIVRSYKLGKKSSSYYLSYEVKSQRHNTQKAYEAQQKKADRRQGKQEILAQIQADLELKEENLQEFLGLMDHIFQGEDVDENYDW